MRCSISLAAVAYALLLTSVTHAAPSSSRDEHSYTMVLEQRTGKDWNTPAKVNQVLAKYGIMDQFSRLGATAEVELESAYVDVEYLGTIGVGTPPQYFSMNLDTGSADVWFPSESCTSCGNRTLFMPSESSSFEAINETWSLRYGDGSGVHGITGKDTLHIGNVSHPDQVIGLATFESADFARDKYMDGIFGLAFSSLSYTGQKQSVIESMYAAGQIDEPIVGIYLGRLRDGGKGEAKFGGVNPAHYSGEIKYIPVTVKRYWQVDFGGIQINGRTRSSPGNAQAIIDTGTTLTVLPPPLARAFHEAIPGAQYSNMYGWRVPCKPNTDDIVIFKLGGEEFPIPIVDMVRERATPGDPTLCFSGVAEANTNLVIMGDTFLRSYYSVYDYKNARVGLAPSKA